MTKDERRDAKLNEMQNGIGRQLSTFEFYQAIYDAGYESRDAETCLLTRIPDKDEKLMNSLRYDSECGRETWFGVDEGSDVIETDKYCGDCGRRIKVQEESDATD